MFRLETFGGLVVVDEADAKVATQPRRLALLALLAVAGARGLTRAKLQAYLWPESSTESARHGLEQLLYYLRRQLTPDAFLGQDPLRLNPAVITSDVTAFEQALAGGADAEAVAVYRGPFLDGFFVNGAPGFERWAEEERSRLAESYQDGLRRLAEAEGARGRHPEAIGWWRKLVASDPLSGRAALGLMRALVATGDRPAALLFARSYTSLIRDELAAPLPPEVVAYVAQLGEASPQPSQEKGRARPLAPPSPVAGFPSADGLAVEVASVPQEGREVRRARHLLAAGVGVGAIVTIGGLLTLGLQPTGATPLDPNLVAVAPFDVLGSGLDLWHEGMVDLLSRRLDGAGPLRTVAPSVVIRRWSGRADEPSAVKLGRQTGASIVIYGSLVGIGADSVRLNATLVELGARRPLFELELRNTVDRMDRLVDSSTVKLLDELGRTRPIGPVRYAQTTSLPALKSFLQGEQHFRRMVWDSAQLYFERALAADSGFALLIRHLAEVQRWKFGAEDSFRAYAFRAAALNRGLSARESLLIVADSLEAAVWQNRSDAAAFRTCGREVDTWEEAARRYPGDPEAWYGLGEARFHLAPEIGVTLQKQLDAFDQAIALDPGFLQADPHAVSLAIQLGGAALGRRYAALYLAWNPSGEHALGVRIVHRLLALPPQDSGALARWADSISGGKAFERVGEALGRWADSAETGLRLAQAVMAPGGKFLDSDEDRPRLAAWLASRGHLQEAAGLLGSSPSATWPHLYVDLAMAGAVPPESASLAFHKWQLSEDVVAARAGTAFLATVALPWWSAQGDTLMLHRMRQRAESRARLESDQGRLGAWQYMARAARAYLALARQDSVDALHHFLTLPDSLCLECDFDRLQTAMLLSAARRDREAFDRLERVFPTESKPPPRPSETRWVLERGRVAERLQKREAASRAYAWVAGIWRNADAQLQVYVTEARAGLARLKPNGSP